MSMQQNNHMAYLRSLKKEAAEKRAKREEELENGSPLNRFEKHQRMVESIEEDEKRLGFGDLNDEPTVVTTIGSTARNAWVPNGTLREVMSDGSVR